MGTQKKKVFLGCSIGALVGIGSLLVAVALFVVFGISMVTGAYFNNPWDRAKLRAMCDPLKDVPGVLADHHAKHGEYPESIQDLDPSLPGATDAVSAFASNSSFIYSRHRTGYDIYRKLNWDGGIRYSSWDPYWKYFINEDVEWTFY